MICVFFLALFTFASAQQNAFAQEKKTIYWLIWEQTPEYVKRGQYAGQGYADKALKFFSDNLPEYKHTIHRISVRRWEREAGKSQRCSPYLWNHFLKDKLTYSKAYTLSPPHSVIFLKQGNKVPAPPGSVLSLEKLLTNKDLALVTLPVYIDKENKEPRYPILHKYLAPYLGQRHLIELSHNVNEVDLNLLVRKRADYAIGYTTTVIAQQRDRGLGDWFVTYGLKEHQEFKTIHAACFGDAFGKEVIAKINGLLNQETLPQFLGFQEEWNGGSPAFRAAFEKRFLTD